MGFLNPALLWALPLCAIPIIIHLLNKRRFKIVRWAAIEFLLNALKRNKRRLQMEHWLLLLLRTLLVALLVFLVARPQLSGGILTTQRTHHVYVLDDSCSMLQRAGAQNVWRGALETLRLDLDRLALERSGDLFTLLRLSRPEAPDLAAVRVSGQLPARVRQLLDAMQCGEGGGDLAKALAAARQRIAESKEASRAEVRLLTDFRRHDWLTKDGKARPEVQAALMALDPAKQKVAVVALAPKDQKNVGIADITRQDRLAVVGMACTFAIEVQNRGLVVSDPLDLTVEIDGTGRMTKPVDRIEPGQSQVVYVQQTFTTAGFHKLVAELPAAADSMQPDNKRALSIEVRDRSKALVVDGDPGSGGDESETHFLLAALEPGGDAISGIAPQPITDGSLQDQDLSDIDTIWLCNVAAPTEPVVKKLEEFVAKGGGLAIFLGNQVDNSRYAQALWKDGKGLLPLQLGEIAGDFDRRDAGFLSNRTHQLVAGMSEAIEFLLQKQVQIGRVVTAIDDPKRSVSVVMRVRDQQGPPLLVLGPYGERGGTVALCTTTADLAWSSFARSNAFLPVVNELHKLIAKPQSAAAWNLSSVGTLVFTLDSAQFRPDIVVRDPEAPGSERTFTAVPIAGDETKLETRVPMADLSGFGVFEVVVTPFAGVRETRLVARSAPGEECLVATMATATLQGAYPADALQRLEVVESSKAAGVATQGEVWKTIAWVLLAFLILETVLAWRFGRGAS